MPDIHQLDGGTAPVNLGGGYTLRAPGLTLNRIQEN